ncbi:MAG: hypothetical protein AAB352_00920 [Patescibacteria group bacterium]
MKRILTAPTHFGVFLVTVTIVYVTLMGQFIDQQRQIDQLSLTIMEMVKSQNPVSEGEMIKAGVTYNLYFADFKKNMAVLTSKDEHGKTVYTIVYSVSEDVLKEWCVTRIVDR